MYHTAAITPTARRIVSTMALKVFLLICHLNFQGNLKKKETVKAKKRSNRYEKEIVDGILCQGNPQEKAKYTMTRTKKLINELPLN
jgi:hypothetical protein